MRALDTECYSITSKMYNFINSLLVLTENVNKSLRKSCHNIPENRKNIN